MQQHGKSSELTQESGETEQTESGQEQRSLPQGTEAAQADDVARPETGVYMVTLECGHEKEIDFARKTNKKANPPCSPCKGLRRRIAKLRFISESKKVEEPEESRAQADDSASSTPLENENFPDSLDGRIDQLSSGLMRKHKELENARMQIKTLTDAVSAKDATIRKYLAHIANLTETVNKANDEVAKIRDQQDTWRKEQREEDAEIHASDIQNNWVPKLEVATTRANVAEANLRRELNRPVVLSVGQMIRITALLRKQYDVCHINRKQGQPTDIQPGRPVTQMTHDLVKKGDNMKRPQPAAGTGEVMDEIFPDEPEPPAEAVVAQEVVVAEEGQEAQ